LTDTSLSRAAFRPAVTGANGVLGRILCERLVASGADVSRFSGDVRDLNSVLSWVQASRPSHLFHLAAKVPVDVVKEAPLAAFETNVLGTGHVLATVAKHSPECWTFVASSSHVYGSSNRPVAESANIAPANIYGETKLAADRIAQFFLERIQLRVCIGRIFSFYHATQRKPFLYPSIMERIASHDPKNDFELRGGEDVRDLSKAEDVIGAILALKDVAYTGVINIGSGRATRIRDFVSLLGNGNLRIRVIQELAPTSLVADVARLKKVLSET